MKPFPFLSSPLLLVTIFSVIVPLITADEMLCFTETWHFVAYDDDGSIIDEWDETYTDCFAIGSGDDGGSGGSGNGGDGGGGSGGSDGDCEGFSRHFSVETGQVPATVNPKKDTLQAQFDRIGDISVANPVWVDLAALGLNYIGFRNLILKRRNNLLLIDRDALRGGMLVADFDGSGKPDRAGDFFVSQVTVEGLRALAQAANRAPAERDFLADNGCTGWSGWLRQ